MLFTSWSISCIHNLKYSIFVKRHDERKENRFAGDEGIIVKVSELLSVMSIDDQSSRAIVRRSDVSSVGKQE